MFPLQCITFITHTKSLKQIAPPTGEHLVCISKLYLEIIE